MKAILIDVVFALGDLSVKEGWEGCKAVEEDGVIWLMGQTQCVCSIVLIAEAFEVDPSMAYHAKIGKKSPSHLKGNSITRG